MLNRMELASFLKFHCPRSLYTATSPITIFSLFSGAMSAKTRTFHKLVLRSNLKASYYRLIWEIAKEVFLIFSKVDMKGKLRSSRSVLCTKPIHIAICEGLWPRLSQIYNTLSYFYIISPM